jgi:hypothetical protein
MQFAKLQWPAVQERAARSTSEKASGQEPTKVVLGGKRKASIGGAKGSGRSSKPKLGASGKLSDEQFQKDIGGEALPHLSSARPHC